MRIRVTPLAARSWQLAQMRLFPLPNLTFRLKSCIIIIVLLGIVMSIYCQETYGALPMRPA